MLKRRLSRTILKILRQILGLCLSHQTLQSETCMVLIELPSNSVMNCTAFSSLEHITDGNKGVIFNQGMLQRKRFLLTLWSLPLKSISDWRIKCDYIYTSLTQFRQQNNSLPETFFFFIFRSVRTEVLGEWGGDRGSRLGCMLVGSQIEMFCAWESPTLFSRASWLAILLGTLINSAPCTLIILVFALSLPWDSFSAACLQRNVWCRIHLSCARHSCNLW